MSLVNLSSRGGIPSDFTNVLDAGVTIPKNAQVCMASYHGNFQTLPITPASYTPVIERDFNDAFIMVDEGFTPDPSVLAAGNFYGEYAKHTVMPRMIVFPPGLYEDSNRVQDELERLLNEKVEDFPLDQHDEALQRIRFERCQRICSTEWFPTLTPSASPNPLFEIKKRKYYSGMSCLSRFGSGATAEWELTGNQVESDRDRLLFRDLVNDGDTNCLADPGEVFVHTIITDNTQNPPVLLNDVDLFPRWTGGHTIDGNGNFENQPLAGISIKFREGSPPDPVCIFIDKPIWTGNTENAARQYNFARGQLNAGHNDPTAGGNPNFYGKPQIRNAQSVPYSLSGQVLEVQGFTDYGNVLMADFPPQKHFIFGVIGHQNRFKEDDPNSFAGSAYDPFDTSAYEFGIKHVGNGTKLFAHYYDQYGNRQYHEIAARRNIPISSNPTPPMYYYAICPRQDHVDAVSLGGVFANGSTGIYGWDFYQTKRDPGLPQNRYTPIRDQAGVITNNWEFIGSIEMGNYTDTVKAQSTYNSGPNILTYHFATPALYLAYSSTKEFMAYPPDTNYPARREFLLSPMFCDGTDYTVPTAQPGGYANAPFLTSFVDSTDTNNNLDADKFSVGFYRNMRPLFDEMGSRGINLARSLRLNRGLSINMSTINVIPTAPAEILMQYGYDFEITGPKQNFIITIPSLSAVGVLGGDTSAQTTAVLGHGLVNIGHGTDDNQFALQMPVRQWVDLKNSNAFTCNNLQVRLLTSDGLPYKALSYFEVMIQIRQKPGTFSNATINELIV